MEKVLQTIIFQLEQKKPELVNRFNISTLSLFGSYARGEESIESDVDILVSFKRLPSLFEFIDLQMYLAEIIGKKVDLVILDDLKPGISLKVLQEKITVL